MTAPEATSAIEIASAPWRRSSPFPFRVKDWELVEAVAESQLARTYRARPATPSGDRPAGYALKLLRRRWEEDPRAVALFRREVLVGQTVRHSHLVSVLSASVKQPPYFLVTPWLDGSTLAAQLAAGVQPDLPTALWTVRQAAEALGALHEAGWMHGDVKPSNLLLAPEGHLTLLDLGFARRRGETGSAADRCVMGTCNYIAPEAITSALATDIRSDIYSLGVVLFEVLAGRLPFEAADLAELATQHQQARPPELRRLAPHLPAEVICLVQQMLAKQPLRRPQTPAELAQRLTALEIATFTQRAWA